MENAAVRTSTDATFVLATMIPSNHIPGSSVKLEIQTRINCGAASGGMTGAAGHTRGAFAETTRFGGMVTGFDSHAPSVTMMAHANSAGRCLRTSRKAGRMRGQSIEVERTPFPREKRPGAPSLLDWLVTLAVTWTITGLFIDAHEHLFETVETFLNPWHVTMYTGAVVAAAALSIATARNRRADESFWQAVPQGYRPSVAGVAGLLLGGALDSIWHAIFGFEHQLDLLLSPPHLILLTGLFFLAVGPVRSALARPAASRLVDQLPMLISMGLAFEVIQFVMQIAFYPEALQRDRPLSQIVFHDEQFVLSVFLFYKQALEMVIVIWQSALLAAAVLYLCARTRLAFGALIVVCVAEKLWVGGELSSDVPEFLLLVLASAAAGLAGDVLISRLEPSPQNSNAFRLLGFVVPATYFGAYFTFAVPIFGGTWWDSSFLFGSIALAGIVGVCVSQLFIGGFQARPPNSA